MLEEGSDKINSYLNCFSDKSWGPCTFAIWSLFSLGERVLYLKKLYITFVLSRQER